jgi:peptidoglycan hydrolase-like protein with peptidoglycan-binding domain
MFLAGKAAGAGIAFMLLMIATSGPGRMRLTSGAKLSTDAPGLAFPNDVIEIQQTLQDKGQYRGKVDGVLGLRTRASIRAYQKAENLPVTGGLDTQTAGRLGIAAEIRDVASFETTQDKPSAGVKWANGSRRKDKQPRKKVIRSAGTVPPE